MWRWLLSGNLQLQDNSLKLFNGEASFLLASFFTFNSKVSVIFCVFSTLAFWFHTAKQIICNSPDLTSASKGCVLPHRHFFFLFYFFFPTHKAINKQWRNPSFKNSWWRSGHMFCYSCRKRRASALKRRLQWLQQQFIVMKLSACTCTASSKGEGEEDVSYFKLRVIQ